MLPDTNMITKGSQPPTVKRNVIRNCMGMRLIFCERSLMPMGRMTEQSMKAVHEWLEKNTNGDMSIDEVNELLREHLEEINQSISRPNSEKEAKTSEDFLYLSENRLESGNEQEALRFARKALKLDPYNLDAELIVIEHGEKNPLNILKRLRLATEKGEKYLQKRFFFDDENIGEFWQIIETRPYMRMRYQYAGALCEFGMLRKAAREYEELLRLNAEDNLGVRWELIHIYAALEDKEAAEALLAKYSEHDESVMLLAVALLNYRLGMTDKALEYVKKLLRVNKELKLFLKDYLGEELEGKIKRLRSRGAFRPFSEEEIIIAYYEHKETYDGVFLFFYWMAEELGVA